MHSEIEMSAQAIADALAPTQTTPSARWRWGTVKSVSEYGTMNVEVGGSELVGIRCAQHVMGAQVGDRVRVLYCGTEAMVDAVRASSALMSVPSPSMDADTQAAWLDALGLSVSTFTPTYADSAFETYGDKAFVRIGRLVIIGCFVPVTLPNAWGEKAVLTNLPVPLARTTTSVVVQDWSSAVFAQVRSDGKLYMMNKSGSNPGYKWLGFELVYVAA